MADSDTLVLLVDDEPENLDILSRHFGLAGFSTVTAPSAGRAVKSALAMIPDAVVMDYHLPDATGLEAARQIKAAPKTAHIPILILTGVSDAKIKMTCLRCGVDNYIVKDAKAWDLIPLFVKRLIHKTVEVRGTLILAGPLTLDPGNQSAYVSGRNIALSQKEFILLETILKRYPDFATWEELQKDCWACRTTRAKSTAAIMMTLCRLKKKLGPEVAARIETARSIGVRFLPPFRSIPA